MTRASGPSGVWIPWLDACLSKFPHVLVAGVTGSGKSVAVHSLVAALVAHGPSKLRLILIDPKQVELSLWQGIPHLAREPVWDMAEAAEVLEREADTVHARLTVLRKQKLQHVRELASPPPYTAIVVDELANLLQTQPDVIDPLVTIAQLGRAAGTHLILATQRPDAETVPGQLRSNLAARLCLKVSTPGDCQIALGRRPSKAFDPRKLKVGQGIWAHSDTKHVTVPYIDREGILATVAAWRNRETKPKTIADRFANLLAITGDLTSDDDWS